MNRFKEALGEKYEEFEQLIKAYNENHPESAEEYKQIDEYKAEIERLTKENELTKKSYALKSALKEAGVRDPEYAIFKRGGVEGFSFDKKGKPLGINEALRELRADSSLEHLFERPRAEYNPAGGNGVYSTNPFAAASINLTEQGRLFKESPKQARALAAAAGKKIY